MGLLEELCELGVNTEEALRRMRGNKELYEDLLLGIPEDIADYEIGTYMQGENFKQATLNAHALKGEMANLGVTPLYNWYASLNTLLKEGKEQEAQEVYEEGLPVLDAILDCINKYQ